jgi:large subunit ribosomal protein L12e
MPPKVDPTEVRFSKPITNAVNIKVFGGEAGPAATLAPKLGPLGLVMAMFNVERQEGR